MLDIQNLLFQLESKSHEVSGIIEFLYEMKEVPDYDQEKLRNVYKIYIQKKTEFEELDIQYKTYLKENGLALSGT